MKTLLIEDSPRLTAAIAKALRCEHHVVDTSPDGEDGLWRALNHPYDIVILDLMLPKLDGISVLQELRRRQSKSKVLILSAKGDLHDRVAGLKTGADDYLVKPFELAELIARVEALGRRSYDQASPHLHCGPLAIDTARQTARVHDSALALSAKEYRILEYLALKQNQVVSRSEIEEQIYDAQAEIMSNVIEAAISQIRKKLAQAGLPDLIKTRRGLGYLIES